MVFAAQKMRLNPVLRNPTVLIIVDRIDLDAQISATFYASDVPNLVQTESRQELESLLRQDTRKIIITTIFKFAEADGVLNDRQNIIAMVDEAHRTQEGNLGIKMRNALPNAFLFGLTGTPINRRDRNTFYAFGAEEDERGYMSRYGFEESIRDGATLPLHFEPRLLELHIDKAAIDEAYENLTGSLSDFDRNELAQAAARMKVLVPLTLVIVLLLLYMNFGNLTESLIVLASVPFALVGSIWLMALLGYNLSTAVWVGIIALVGLAAQTGVVMVVYCDSAYHKRKAEGRIRDLDDIVEATLEGSVQRVRPKLMTVATMMIGLVPLLWS